MDAKPVSQPSPPKMGNPRTATVLGFHWSCWADSNRRPHPYQLIGSPGSAAVQRFRGIFVAEGHGLWSFSVHWFRSLVSPCGSACGSSVGQWEGCTQKLIRCKQRKAQLVSIGVFSGLFNSRIGTFFACY